MKKILVIGHPGAGKSTLAASLGHLTGLPVVHLDQLFWKPGWVMSSDEEWIPKMMTALQESAWVIDGSYSGTLRTRLDFADTVIHLDFPRWRCLGRIIKRILRSYGRVRPDLAEGCPERFDWEFLKWAWNYRSGHRKRIEALLHEYRGRLRIIHLTDPASVKRFTDSLER